MRTRLVAGQGVRADLSAFTHPLRGRGDVPVGADRVLIPEGCKCAYCVAARATAKDAPKGKA